MTKLVACGMEKKTKANKDKRSLTTTLDLIIEEHKNANKKKKETKKELIRSDREQETVELTKKEDIGKILV